ncbi:hypothetical protein BBFL7_00228 [Flavobacteria bacterium BBFL7]|nr:hypothetical protein BBFL7_00228 [Flavobacteria bacterium BBFL7]
MRFFFLFLFLNTFILQAQELTGQQLLDKAIQHHDPNGNWSGFAGHFQVTMTTPDRPERVSDIMINNSQNVFELKYNLGDSEYIFKTHGSDCESFLNSKKFESSECRKASFWRDYYTYLYGLPMKLEDPGTMITDQVERKTFKGKEYLVLEVMYDENVGSDVWYFYFDPTTYKMEIYQFFKRDAQGDVDTNSGEYIILTENYETSGINMPKVRKWYYNKDDKFLGTDVITN